MINLIKEGERVPAHYLISDEGKKVLVPGGRLTLLWFDPQKFNKACRNCARETGPFLQNLSDRGIDVYGVTYDDPSKNAEISLYAFENHLRILTAPTEVAKIFGVYREGVWSSIPHRSAFLIDSDGTIIKSWLVEDISRFRQELLTQINSVIVPEKKSRLKRALSNLRGNYV